MSKADDVNETSSREKRRLIRKSTFISLIGISVAAVATMLIVSQSPSIETHYQSAIKPGTNPHMVVTAYAKNDDGNYGEVNAALHAGAEVIFKVSTVTPIYVALIKTANNLEPRAVFDVLIPPGKNRLIEKAGEKYIYTVTDNDDDLTFCVIYGETREQLIAYMKNLKTALPALSSDACIILI